MKNCEDIYYVDIPNFSPHQISLIKKYYPKAIDKLEDPSKLFIFEIHEGDASVKFVMAPLSHLRAKKDTCRNVGTILSGDDIIVEIQK